MTIFDPRLPSNLKGSCQEMEVSLLWVCSPYIAAPFTTVSFCFLRFFVPQKLHVFPASFIPREQWLVPLFLQYSSCFCCICLAAGRLASEGEIPPVNGDIGSTAPTYLHPLAVVTSHWRCWRVMLWYLASSMVSGAKILWSFAQKLEWHLLTLVTWWHDFRVTSWCVCFTCEYSRQQPGAPR